MVQWILIGVALFLSVFGAIWGSRHELVHRWGLKPGTWNTPWREKNR